MNLKVYGCRGSVALCHTRGSRYGGNTSCMTLESDGQMLIIDAGSGIMQLEKDLRKLYPDYPINLPFAPNILISHLHLDHLIGLPTFGLTWNNDAQMRIFTCSRDKRPLKDQIFGIFEPPYWPVSVKSLTAAECIAIQPDVPFVVGPFTITAFMAEHPNCTLSFHITNGSKVFVHLLDSEIAAMSPDGYEHLLKYCRGADMVVSDAAYSFKDYPKHKGWGHSTMEDGLRLAADSGCKRVLYSHFSQKYSDDELDSWAERVGNKDKYIFAQDGMEFLL